MIIRELILKNFGKFSGTSLELKPGINIIYGGNESGKSTVHTFIRGMLFGIRRLRGRASRTDDYSRYVPWENPGWYEGAVRFACGGKEFRLERNFKKGEEEARLVCETDGELLSVEDGDLEVLLGEISEAVYENTVSVGQMKSRTGEALVTEFQNYFSNYQGGGDGRLDVEKARTILKAKKREWEQRAEEKEQKQEKEEEKLQYEMRYLREEINMLEEKSREEMQRLKDKKDILTRFDRTKQEERKEICLGENVPVKGNNRGILVWGLILALILFLILSVVWNPAGGAVGAILLICTAFGMNVFMRQRRNREWETAQGARNKAAEEAGEKQPAGTAREEAAELQRSLDEQEGRIRLLRTQMEEKRIRLSNLSEELEDLRRAFAEEQKEQQELRAVNLARETLERLICSMQDFAGEALKEEISGIFAEMTEGRYEKVSVDENLQIDLFARDRHVPLYMASSGTKEQVYLALRLAAGRLLCQEEPMPILLDEVFAMYDDKRLLQSLKWLAEEKEQVLIFTCNKREMHILEQSHIPYHIISLR